MSDWYIYEDSNGARWVTGPTWIESPLWDADEAERQARDLMDVAHELRWQEADT